ncbi:hypothetical protein BC831DRAFT_59587 [Entophlyctis helioformis]|nr:hypothetical protein BC831DRAFT_59587 [Entophlyctis helioformis]
MHTASVLWLQPHQHKQTAPAAAAAAKRLPTQASLLCGTRSLCTQPLWNLMGSDHAQPSSHPAARPSVCLPDRDRKQHFRLDRPLTAPASRACSDLPLRPLSACQPVSLSACQPVSLSHPRHLRPYQTHSWGHIHGETRDSGLSTAGGLVGRSVSRPVGQSVRWLAAVQVPFGSTECGPLQSAMAADLNPDPPRSAMADRCAPWGNHDCKRGLAIGSLEQQAPAANTSTSEPRRVTSRLGVQRLASVCTVSTCCTCCTCVSVGRAWLACGSTSVAGRGTQPVCEQPLCEQPPTRARLPSRAAGK